MKNLNSRLHTQFVTTCLFTAIFIFSTLISFAQKTSTGSGNWNVAGSWTPAGVPASTDNVTIAAGHTISVNAGGATCQNITITGTLSLQSNNLTVTGNWINNGSFNQNCNCGGTNQIIMTGNNTTIGGSVTSNFWELVINPGAGNSVTLANTNVVIKNQGTLYLQSGVFRIGAANTLTMSDNGQQASINASGGGNFANSTNGFTDADGGTINANLGSGAQMPVTGNVTFNNITSVNDGNWQLNLGAASRINGTLTAIGASSWGFEIHGIAPTWGSSSTYYKDRANQGLPATYIGGSDKAWAVSTGTIGVTPGYPNNITLVNMGSSQGGTGGTGWVPTGAVGLNGTLQVGSSLSNGRISLESATSLNVGGIIVENNSLMVGPLTAAPFTDRGNFTLAGATTGVFQSMGATINFAGTGTKASPQTISTTGAIVSFTNMTVSSGTYVTLLDPVNITGILNLASGYVGTTTTNTLNINNTATTAVTGGSATAYVDGPLSWSIPATTTASYVFPIGDLSNNGGAYLPLTLSPNTTSGAVTTATAFNLNSGGSHDATITTTSTTEYWSLTNSSPFTSGSSVSVTRQNAVSPNNALGQSSTSNGVYTSIGGSPSGNSMNNGGLSTGSPTFLVLAFVPLQVVRIGGTNVTCSGTLGSVTVGGSGGSPLYQFSMTGGAPWFPGAPASSYTFTSLAGGNYTVTVKDNLSNIATNMVKVLGSVVINGNNKDVDICPTQSTTLTATNLQNTTPTYSWVSSPATVMSPSNTSPSITVSPTVNPTTYTVTSTLYTNNLITNGGFESGNDGSFTSSYAYYTGAQYGTTPGPNGYYSLTNAGSNQCQFFTQGVGGTGVSLPPYAGGAYFIGDAATVASNVWSTTVAVTAGKTYKFQYYYAAANPDNAARPQMQTSITGVAGTLTGTNNIIINNSSAWTQATYTFAATATGTATITLRNITASGSTNANDFFLDNMEFLDPCTVTSTINVTINCTLPVDLISFNATNHGNGALLTWTTTSETNSSHFIVQKSSDGISFNSIGKVNAAGNSSALNNYSFVDPSISAGITYYRLVQYDFDGQSHYSEIKSVTKNSINDVQVYPNPNNGIFTIVMNNTGEVKTRVTIINAIGQVVYERHETTANELTIDISPLAVGIYYLQIGSVQDSKVIKIIKE